MAPPSFSDLGKDAKNIFSKGYHFGLIQLDCKTKSASGVEFSSGGVSNQETGKVFGSLETKYCFKDWGLTLSEKWNTDNTLGTTVSWEEKILQGLKTTFDCTFAPQTGNKTGVLKTEYKNQLVSVNCDVDLDLNGPNVLGAGVLTYNGWIAGYQMGLDTQNMKMTKNCFALGFAAGDFVLHTNVDDGQEFGGSIYQRVSSCLETGVQIAWSTGSNDTKFGIGCKYDFDKDASVRAKVNNSCQLGLGYSQRLRDGISVSLSALIDGKNFNQGGHKIGVSVELNA